MNIKIGDKNIQPFSYKLEFKNSLNAFKEISHIEGHLEFKFSNNNQINIFDEMRSDVICSGKVFRITKVETNSTIGFFPSINVEGKWIPSLHPPTEQNHPNTKAFI